MKHRRILIEKIRLNSYCKVPCCLTVYEVYLQLSRLTILVIHLLTAASNMNAQPMLVSLSLCTHFPVHD